MAHTICGVCFSLNKSTSYLSLCLSLNSFCIETSRTWASLSLETKCETVGSSSNLSYMVSASGFIICLTEQRTHLPWNWKTQILSGKGYSKHKTTYIWLELSFKFEWLSPVKSLLMCEWKAREFRKASGEKNNPRSQQDFKRKLHFTSSHVCVCVCVCVRILACAVNPFKLYATPWTAAHQTLLSTRLPRQEHWSGLPSPSSGDLPHPGIKSTSPVSPALTGITAEPTEVSSSRS